MSKMSEVNQAEMDKTAMQFKFEDGTILDFDININWKTNIPAKSADGEKVYKPLNEALKALCEKNGQSFNDLIGIYV